MLLNVTSAGYIAELRSLKQFLSYGIRFLYIVRVLISTIRQEEKQTEA